MIKFGKVQIQSVRTELQIKYKSDFNRNFLAIWDFISQDSIKRANDFKSGLKANIEKIPNMPYKFRKSYYSDNEDIRDMIYKGYTIPYLIDDDVILILDIFKWEDR